MTHADGPLEPSTPGNAHPGVTPLFATFMTVFVVVSAFGNYLFWKRRHTFPISARFPLFAVVGQVLACLWVILDSVRHIQKGWWPCQLVNFVAQICIPLFLANYTVRAFGLLFKFGVARAIAFVDSDGAAKFEAHISDTVLEQREAIKNSQPPSPQILSIDSGPEEPNDGIELNLIRTGSTDSTAAPPGDEKPPSKHGPAVEEHVEETKDKELSLSVSQDIIEDYSYESDDSREGYDQNFFSNIRAGGGSSSRRLAATYFLKRRRFAETPFLWRLYGVALFIHGSVWFSGVIILVDSCDYHTLELVIAGLVFVYLCLWLVLALKLKKTGRDNFGFKEELGLIALFAFTAIVVWSLYGNLPSTLEWDERVFALSDLLPMLAAAPGVYVSIWRPVYISFMSERESEELERKLRIEAQQEMRSKRRSELLAKLTLMQLLETEPGFDTFKMFLQEEFSVENISFWRRINQYRIEGESSKSFVELLRIARLIAHEYIIQDSVMEINISAQQSIEIIQKLGMKKRASQGFVLRQVGRPTSRRNMFQRAPSRQNSAAAAATDRNPRLDRQRSDASGAGAGGGGGGRATPQIAHQHSTESAASVPETRPQSSSLTVPKVLLTPVTRGLSGDERTTTDSRRNSANSASCDPSTASGRSGGGSANRRISSDDNVASLTPATPSTGPGSGDRLTAATDTSADRDGLGSLNKFAPGGHRSRSQSRRGSDHSRSSARSQREGRSLLTPEELRCVFDAAQKEIYNLMAKDSFLRYRRSPFFAQFIQRSACEGGLLEEEDEDEEDAEAGAGEEP